MFGDFLRRAGSVVRRVGDVGGQLIRRFGEPLAASAKPLAHSIQSLVGSNPIANAALGAVGKGLDFVSSGKAAAMADRVAHYGAKMAGAGGNT
jgi:hypothetical protein